MSEQKSLPVVSGLLPFEGVQFLIVTYEGDEYLWAKPLSDFAGTAWNKQKKYLMEPENVVLYGSKVLRHPDLGGLADHMVGLDEDVYILLKRSVMYLARISVRRMKGQGKDEAAERLLARQVEWAQALHDYEFKGAAVKKDHYLPMEQERKEEKAFLELVRVFNDTGNPKLRRALAKKIEARAEKLGCPIQGDLLDLEGV